MQRRQPRNYPYLIPEGSSGATFTPASTTTRTSTSSLPANTTPRPAGRLRRSLSRLSISNIFSSNETETRGARLTRPPRPSSVSTNSTRPTSVSTSSVFTAPPTPSIASSSQTQQLVRHKVSPEEVRELHELHELIRIRCELDVWIWGKRTCYPTDRWKVKVKMDRSDAALAKIITTVRSWDTAHAWETPEDWRKLREVRSRVEERGKRDWASHPPWEESLPSRAVVEENGYSQVGQQRNYMGGERPRAALQAWQEEPYEAYRGRA